MSMTKRTRMGLDEFSQLAPGARAALAALTKAVDDSGLEKTLTELIKIRASQINGCAFCLQFHLNLARKVKVAQTKLDLVAVWREAGVFTAREMAALAWTEALTHMTSTHMTSQGISDDVYEAVAKEFSESELASLTVAIGTINAWNRIAIAFCFAPPIPQDGAQV
jgi:AhpD family alkylhydroperoxidase